MTDTTTKPAMLAGGQHRLGCSQIAAALGRSDFADRTPFGVWHDKQGPRPERDESMYARGHILEPALLAKLGRHLGADVRPNAESIAHPNGWLSGTPDALIYNEGGILIAGGEAKSSVYSDGYGESDSAAAGLEALAIVPSMDYVMQVIGYLHLCDLPRWHVVVGFVPFSADEIAKTGRAAGVPDEQLAKMILALPHVEIRYYTIHRDMDDEAAIIEAAGDWTQHHIIEGHEPELDWSSAAADRVRLVTRQKTRAIIEADAAGAELVAEWHDARALKTDATKAEKTAGHRLQVAIGEDKGIRSGLGRVTMSRIDGRVTCDHRRLIADHPDIAETVEQYIKQGAGYNRLNAPKSWSNAG